MVLFHSRGTACASNRKKLIYRAFAVFPDGPCCGGCMSASAAAACISPTIDSRRGVLTPSVGSVNVFWLLDTDCLVAVTLLDLGREHVWLDGQQQARKSQLYYKDNNCTRVPAISQYQQQYLYPNRARPTVSILLSLSSPAQPRHHVILSMLWKRRSGFNQ
jgi:hypothetical protein